MTNLRTNLFKVLSTYEWAKFKKKKEYNGNSLDHKSGFIHLSTQRQLKKTINLYFKKDQKIVILKFNSKDLNQSLKWELSRNNEFFPHLYDSLNYKDVKKVEFSESRI